LHQRAVELSTDAYGSCDSKIIAIGVAIRVKSACTKVVSHHWPRFL